MGRRKVEDKKAAISITLSREEMKKLSMIEELERLNRSATVAMLIRAYELGGKDDTIHLYDKEL